MLDIGGGSLEIAAGLDEEPDVAISLPLGAARLTRVAHRGTRQPRSRCGSCASMCAPRSRGGAADVARAGTPDRAVATSKTFRQLARIAGAAPSEGRAVRAAHRHPRGRDRRGETPAGHVRRSAGRATRGVPRPGAPARGRALVADAAMDLLGLAELEICPWALREGMLCDGSTRWLADARTLTHGGPAARPPTGRLETGCQLETTGRLL